MKQLENSSVSWIKNLKDHNSSHFNNFEVIFSQLNKSEFFDYLNDTHNEPPRILLNYNYTQIIKHKLDNFDFYHEWNVFPIIHWFIDRLTQNEILYHFIMIYIIRKRIDLNDTYDLVVPYGFIPISGEK